MEPGYFSISSHPGKDVSITRHPRQEAGALGPRLCLARPPHHPSELQPSSCALTSDPTPLVGLALPHPSPGQPRGSHPHTILIQTPRLTQARLWPPDTHGHHPSCPASVSASACGYTQPPPPPAFRETSSARSPCHCWLVILLGHWSSTSASGPEKCRLHVSTEIPGLASGVTARSPRLPLAGFPLCSKDVRPSPSTTLPVGALVGAR